METQPERSQFVCGICGATAEERASPLHPPLEGPIVIRTHVLEAHEVTAQPGRSVGHALVATLRSNSTSARRLSRSR